MTDRQLSSATRTHEALRLAAILDNKRGGAHDDDIDAIVDELRRLAAVEAEREADRAAMRVALEALKSVRDLRPNDETNATITTLRERLEAQ